MHRSLLPFLLAITLISFFSLSARSQKIVSSTPEYEWSVAAIRHDAEVNHIWLDQYVFGKYNLTTSPTEQILPVKIGKKQWGVVKINSDGKEIWRYDGTDDDLLGIGWMGSDIVVFYTNDIYYPKYVKAQLLNAKKGTKLKEKQVSQTNFNEVTLVQNNPDGVFSNLLLINDKKDLLPRIITVDAELNASAPITLNSSLRAGDFAGCIINNKGEIFFGGFTDDQFSISKYARTGALIKTHAMAMERKSERMTSVLQLLKDGDGVLAAVNYKPERKRISNRLLRFDFAAAKVSASEEQLLSRDFLKDGQVQTIKGVNEGMYKYIEDAVAVGIVQWEDRIIMLTEIRTRFTHDPRKISYRNDAWLSCSYDKNLKLSSVSGIDKEHESFLPISMSLGFKLYGDKLFVISTALRGPGKYAALFTSVDLKTNRIEKGLRMDEMNMKLTNAMESGATIWFENSLLLEEMRGKLMSPVIKATFYNVKWD